MMVGACANASVSSISGVREWKLVVDDSEEAGVWKVGMVNAVGSQKSLQTVRNGWKEDHGLCEYK